MRCIEGLQLREKDGKDLAPVGLVCQGQIRIRVEQ